MKERPDHKMPQVALWDAVGLGLIIPMKTGVLFTNQVHGTGCLHPEVEGFYVPIVASELRNEDTMVRIQNRFPEGGWGGFNLEDADFLDDIFKSTLLSWLRVNRTKITDSCEAWVHVTINVPQSDQWPLIPSHFHEGILTWPNSD